MIWAFKNVTYASTCKGWAKKRVMPAKKFTEAWTYSSSRKIQAAQFAVVSIAVANFVVHIFQASKISFGIWSKITSIAKLFQTIFYLTPRERLQVTSRVNMNLQEFP